MVNMQLTGAQMVLKALEDQQRAGTIVTFDVLPHRTPMYWNCIDDHDGPKTRFQSCEYQNRLECCPAGRT